VTQSARINNPESCVLCSRRADGLAVGRPDHLGWYCSECEVELAMRATKAKDFDIYETRAAVKVADSVGGDLSVPAVELAAFVKWVVDEFAKAIRDEVASGKAPF
jgi:hypothetical protein